MWNLHGQNSDSTVFWKQQLVVAKTDSAKMELYCKLIEVNMDTHPLTAINYMLDAYCNTSSLLYSQSYPKIQKWALVINSKYSYEQDSILKARVSNFKHGEPELHLAIYYSLLGFDANYRGMEEEAIKYGVKAGEIFSKINYPEGEYIQAMRQFIYYLSQQQWKQAKAEIDKIVPSQFTKFPNFYVWVKYYMLQAYFQTYAVQDTVNLPNIDSALYYGLKAIEAAPTPYFKAYMAGEIGSVYSLLKQYDKSLAYIQEAIDGQYKIGNMVEYYRLLEYKAEVLFQKGDFKTAIDISKNVISNISVSYEANAYIGALRNLSESYSKDGDYKEAYQYRIKYEQVNDSLNSAQSKKNITEAQTKYETEKKDKEIVVQKTQLNRQRFINYGVVAIAVLLILFLAFVYRNFLQKKKANVELQKAKETAEQSERFKQQFLANMSHEIRTPMNAVMGMTALVLDSPLNPKQRKYLTGVKKASDNLLHIINDILDLSKIEAGKIELEQIDFSVRDLIEQVCETLKHKADEKGIELISDVAVNVPEVIIGDSMRLNQVLLNLAGNAIKFTEKGSVEISVKTNSSPNYELQSLNFSITDTGIGIQKEKLEHVFESFSQAHSSDTRKFGGTGLGLTISKQLVELMGGNISIESEEGSGSTFSFTLEMPIGSREKLLEQKSSEQIDGSILNGLKILLADDNADNRVVARDTLELKANVTIVEAINGQEVMHILSKEDFDIILMDVQMPVMDGYEATRQIRNDFSSPKKDIPIIALTASVVRSDLDKCRAAGMNDYVPKPFKTHQLITSIAKLTGREIKYKPKDDGQQTIDKEQSSMVNSKWSIVDLTYLEEFCEGDKIRMQKYTNIFLDSAPVLMEKLNAGLGENNFQKIANQVHGFKTNWIMMGMYQASEIAAKIELDCRREHTDYSSVKKETANLMNIISEAINELKIV